MQTARGGARGNDAPDKPAPAATAPESTAEARAAPEPRSRTEAASPRPAPAAAPAEARIRVFIHYAAGPANALPAMQLAAYLGTHGFPVADIRAVKFDIGWPSVRYFFDRDRPGSRRLVEAVDRFFADAPDRAPDGPTDFTYFAPKPTPGNVEIWLPGTRGSAHQSS